MLPIKSVVIIGSGNVATHLAKILHENGIIIKQVFSRDFAHAKALANNFKCDFTDKILEIDKSADLYIFAVKDDSLAELASHISLPEKMLVHTGGALPTNALVSSSENYGVFYPLQTFSKNREISWKNIPVCIEASNEKMLNALEKLANLFSKKIIKTNYEQRKNLHVAAVFVNNFTNHLLEKAQEITLNAGLDFEILKPLAEETINKAFEIGPKNAQTGPAIRSDDETINKHLELLNQFPEIHVLYKLLTESIKTKN